MGQEFKTIYDELKNKYGEKYKPAISQKTKRIGLRMFFVWMVISFIQALLRRIGFEESTLYVLVELLTTLIIVILIILVLYMLNKNMEYWKKAFEFKQEIGNEFWKAVNSNIKYQPLRNEIDSAFVKKELDNMLNQNTTIIEIEESLEFENKKMYTVRYNNEDQTRFNGVFVIIEKFKLAKNNDNIEKIIKESNLNIAKDLKKAVEKDDKLYLLIDAVEVFKFADNDYFNERQLYDNFLRFHEIIKEKWIV